MEIINAYYINNAQDQMEVKYKLPEEGDAVFVARTSKDDKIDSLWSKVRQTFSHEKLVRNTNDYIVEIEERRERQEQLKKQKEVENLNDILFKAKLEVFEMDEIKSSKNRTMKSKIRKAESVNQVYIYAGALIAIETINSKESK